LEDDNIDQILAEIEKPAEDRPMTGEAAPAAAPAAETPAPAHTWNAKEWEFDWNGRKVAPDSREKAITWLQQGHNYSQRAAELNRKEREFQSQAEKYKGYDRYDQINSYAKENPDWWKFVESQWHQRSAFQPGQTEQTPLDPRLGTMLSPLHQEIEQLRAWRETAEQQVQREAQAREDEALQADIDSIREKHPTIDFDAVDETGRTLEARICEHGAKEGIKSFRAAFRDYLHDHLVDSAKAQTLTAQAKGKAPAPAAKGSTPPVAATPKRQRTPEIQTKGRSYDDITKSVMDEYGLQ
jgi:phage-related protein